MTFGFIILRHVSDVPTNEYWLRCYSAIRKWYPENKVVIIDDDSDYTYLVPNEVDDLSFTSTCLHNVCFVGSRHKKRGELLPYVYYLQNRAWFDKAVFVHDSVFINAHIDFEKLENRVFWDFRHDTCMHDELRCKIEQLIQGCRNSEVLQAAFAGNRWRGCFGGMAVFSFSFVRHVDKRFSLKSLLRNVRTRFDRMALERLLGVFFYVHECSAKPALLGNINEYCLWGYSYDMYLLDTKIKARGDERRKGKSNGSAAPFVPIVFNLPVIKVWTGR